MYGEAGDRIVCAEAFIVDGDDGTVGGRSVGNVEKASSGPCNVCKKECFDEVRQWLLYKRDKVRGIWLGRIEAVGRNKMRYMCSSEYYVCVPGVLTILG